MAESDYLSRFSGEEVDQRLAAVATIQEALASLTAAVAAKYTKPQGGIPETDLDASVQAALALALTALQQQAQSDWNQSDATAPDYIKNKPDIEEMSDLFIAEYGTTTYAEITAAQTAGKTVVLNRSGVMFTFAGVGSSGYRFAAFTGVINIPSGKPTLYAEISKISPGSVWSYEAFGVVSTEAIVTALNAQSSNQEIPGAKCVYDALGLKYEKPASGIPASDLAAGVIPDVSGFVTKSVNDLVNYYLKSETYTKAEVQQLIAAIQGLSVEVVASLPTASADTMRKIYLVPSADPQTQNVKDEYITIDNGAGAETRYTWEQIGSTAIDLSGYVTTTQLNTALAAYTTTANLTTLLAAKQDTISDLASIRSGANAGATAYQKPPTGIPASDLAEGVIPTVPTDVVKYSSQSLADAQKAQARSNIGAGTSDFSGNPIVALATPATPDGTLIATLANGDTIVIDLNHNHPQYPKYVMLQSESDMPATPDSTTLYMWPEE